MPFRFELDFACLTSFPTISFAHGTLRRLLNIRVLARIDPSRLKYANKKSLKGKDICNKLARWDPFTGIVPPTMADPDLLNMYSIFGICGILRQSTPV
jgi:hypothetical protein